MTENEIGKLVVDLTPSNLGVKCIPAVNIRAGLASNVSMVSCGGQTATPMAYAIGQTQGEVEYIEVASSIASESAGPATRANLDEYIETTEECLRVGVMWGNAGLVDTLVRRLRPELGGRPKVIATGGLAAILAPECETVDHVDEGLTLKGLRLLWEEMP